jgi:hypothetical protein
LTLHITISCRSLLRGHKNSRLRLVFGPCLNLSQSRCEAPPLRKSRVKSITNESERLPIEAPILDRHGDVGWLNLFGALKHRDVQRHNSTWSTASLTFVPEHTIKTTDPFEISCRVDRSPRATSAPKPALQGRVTTLYQQAAGPLLDRNPSPWRGWSFSKKLQRIKKEMKQEMQQGLG